MFVWRLSDFVDKRIWTCQKWSWILLLVWLILRVKCRWKGFPHWLGHIGLLVSSFVRIITKRLGNSTADIRCCSNLGKMLFVHVLRLLHAFQSNIRQMINTCWQSLACKQEQCHNDRHNERQVPVRDQNSHSPKGDDEMSSSLQQFDWSTPATPFTESRSHPMSNVAMRYLLSCVRKAISKMEILSFQVN